MTIDLETETKKFAQDVEDLLEGVLPRGAKDAQEPRIRTLKQGPRYVIRTGTAEKAGGVALYAQEKHVGDLEVSFYCSLDSARRFLAVRKSTFQLTYVREGTPLLRLDFLDRANTVPAAHWNVHAERGATSVMLARCNPKHEGLVSQIHLPVGGVRARPCLEDFLDLLIVEFNIDRENGWRGLIQEGRQRWRVFQTKSIVRDSPADAVDVLQSLGYEIIAPPNGVPQQKLEMLRCR